MNKTVLALALGLLLAAPSLAAQRGHHPDPHHGSGKAQPQPTTAQSQERAQLRQQFQTCSQAALEVDEQTREMLRATKAKDFQPDAARQQRDRIRQLVRAMQEEHNRFVQSLDEEQVTRLQPEIHRLQHFGDRVYVHLQAMDQELAQAQPHPEHVAEDARALQEAVLEWHRRHVEIGEKLGLGE